MSKNMSAFKKRALKYVIKNQNTRKGEMKLKRMKEKRNERNKEEYEGLLDFVFKHDAPLLYEESSSEETEAWEEVSVPSRRCMVEAIPPEEEPLTEEEEKLKVLLENFHLSKRERPVPPPQEETHSPIDREWYDALIWRENRRKHNDDDCLITRVVRQSKLTEFFKPKKNN